MAIGVINAICTFANVIGKSFAVFDAGKKIYDQSRKKYWTRTERVDICAQLTFAFLQTVDIFLHLVKTGPSKNSTDSTQAFDNCLITPNRKFAVNCAAGTLDIARSVTHKVILKNGAEWDLDDSLDIAGALFFRAGNIATMAEQTTHKDHDWVCSNRVEIECAANVISTLGVAIAGRRDFMNSRRLLRSRRFALRAKSSDGDSDLNTRPSDRNAASIDERAKKFAEDGEKVFMAYVREMINWERMSVIPGIFGQQNGFVKCKLTGRPIRYVYSPGFDIPGDDGTWVFDKRGLEDAIKENANKVPPGWPTDKVPLKMEYFKPCRTVQRIIDEKLRELAKTLRESFPTLTE